MPVGLALGAWRPLQAPQGIGQQAALQISQGTASPLIGSFVDQQSYEHIKRRLGAGKCEQQPGKVDGSGATAQVGQPCAS